MAPIEQRRIARRPTRARPSRLLAASPLDPWRIEGLIGEGALSRVFAVSHQAGRNGQTAPYAMKVLRRKWSNDAHAHGIFRREAQVAHRVRHANVVTLLAAGLDAPPYYLIMPRLAGTALDRTNREGRAIAPARAFWIARQVAEGLAAIYKTCRMTHGDVKPANIMVSPAGHATLLDLGFARTPSERAATPTGPLIGSLAYSAPETLTSSLASDLRSDIYSLGVVLYEMLAGHRPYDAVDPGRLIGAIRSARPACLGKLRPDLPRQAPSLVHRMLAKEPLRRPQSYAELIDELARLEIACFASRTA